jgi:hypothetical protein
VKESVFIVGEQTMLMTSKLPVNIRSSLWYHAIGGNVKRWDMKKVNEGKKVEQLLNLGTFIHSFFP